MKITENQKSYIKGLTDNQAIRLYQKIFKHTGISTWDTITFKISHPHLYNIISFIAFYDGYNLIKGKRIADSKYSKNHYFLSSSHSL